MRTWASVAGLLAMLAATVIGLAPAGFAGPRDVDSMLRFVDELAAL